MDQSLKQRQQNFLLTFQKSRKQRKTQGFLITRKDSLKHRSKTKGVRNWSTENSAKQSLTSIRDTLTVTPFLAKVQHVVSPLDDNCQIKTNNNLLNVQADEGEVYGGVLWSSRSTQRFTSMSRLPLNSKKQLSGYEKIAEITEEQNRNLKEQNSYLVNKLRLMKEKQSKSMKVYNKAKYYKKQFQILQEELNFVKNETKIYKNWVEDLHEISLIDIPTFQKKVDLQMYQHLTKIKMIEDQDSETDIVTPIKKLERIFNRPLTIQEELHEESYSNQQMF